MSIIEDLYYGKLNPSEQIIPKSSEYHYNVAKISDMLNKLKVDLSVKNYEKVEEILELQGILTSISLASAYRYGHQIGTLMMVDIFGKDNQA
ncbi:hypothetical protein QE450_002058 [Paenibacillus sp. SORGH_AS306]|uniref:DUF6809 family protein n=1 Tax=unclassified Paenibacillus TaxID=185978 RepID=UPI00277E269B|nr:MULTISPECIES: DUF6809 family protein [unclassified Paenibacillus]MDQ1234560.1 hypothetical protein [Paenibacillus sp. SORGH_AS_0306]MDR6111606.1 hypothetical protein [Paenibacillus sp. SORGH_AS_0338]